MKRGGLVLAGLAVLAYWPILNAHPLMDDHLFFAWLEQTPWTEALHQRLSGNWIPYFNQVQMYRPVSGIVQVLAYHLFGPHALPQHLLSFVLHSAASLLAGLLTFRVSRDSRAGWCAAAILLLHPRAALGVSLIFNFHDVLAAGLMLTALLCLWSLKQNAGRTPLKLIGLWLCTGLALGVKELAIPLVAALVLAEWLWDEVGFSFKRALLRQSVTVLLLFAYLFARKKAVGHPFHTHHHPSAFPLPANAESWTLLWDLLLLGCSVILAGFVYRAAKSSWLVSRQVPWIILWSGLMLLPAVHFCSQVTLRPWFFDERYWYVPLVPLSVLGGLCLVQGGWLSAALGAGMFAVTLPLWLGLWVAGVALVTAGALQFHRFHLETQRVVGVLFAAAVALGTLKQCQAIRLRADEAARVHRAVRLAVDRAPDGLPMAFLNFSEQSVERETSFNGDLQWLLQPPFFQEDLNDRLFFSYSTWDRFGANRFRDRTTNALIPELRRGKAVSLYRWDARSQTLDSLGTESWRASSVQTSNGITMKRAPQSASNARRQWRSEKLVIDPVIYRYASLKINSPKGSSLSENAITLLWSSQRSPEQRLGLNRASRGNQANAKAVMWLHLGRYVDWLLAGRINELVVELPAEFDLVALELSSAMPVEIAKQADRVDYYRSPEMKFEWIGESFWVEEP